MKRLWLALVLIGFLFPAPARAVIVFDKGTLAISPTLGPSLGLERADHLFKIGADLDYLFGQSFSLSGGAYFAFNGDLFEAEFSPGVRFRFLQLYKHDIDLGIRGHLYVDVFRGAGQTLTGFGVKFGPSFRYFVTPKIGVGMDLLFKLGAVDIGAAQFLGQDSGYQFAAILDLLFGATWLF